MGGRQGAPNPVLQKSGHAIKGSSGFSAAPAWPLMRVGVLAADTQPYNLRMAAL